LPAIDNGPSRLSYNRSPQRFFYREQETRSRSCAGSTIRLGVLGQWAGEWAWQAGGPGRKEKKAQHARDMGLDLSHREESKGIRERERQSDARHAALGM